jgi:Zn ribbon nucleic-acid-binding protein
MRMTFITLTFCPACKTWHNRDAGAVIWREHQFWCSKHAEPVKCTGTTSFPRLDFSEGEQC